MYVDPRDVEMARQAFSHHQIRGHRTEERCLIARPDCVCFWTELIAGGAGTLIIHGDGPDFIFRTYRRGLTLENLCRWCAKPSYDYIASKVAAGRAVEYDAEVAVRSLREYAEDLEDGKRREFLLRLPAYPDKIEFNRHVAYSLASEFFDDAWEMRLGDRATSGLIHAVAAAQRLVALIDAENPEENT